MRSKSTGCLLSIVNILSVSSTPSITHSKSVLSAPGLLAKPGNKVRIYGQSVSWSAEELRIIDSVSGSEFTLNEYWPKRHVLRGLKYHVDSGHAFWPNKGSTAYECHRCGMVKYPGMRAAESCNEFLVDAVHDR